MKRMPINNANQRLAFTLIELLIVMGIIVLIAAISLPTFKDLLKDQKTSQTARVIQGFAESAKARAIGSGRPVAMIIERMYVDGSRDLEGNDTSTRLSIGEVFPPYEGDWANSTATISGVDGVGTSRGTKIATITYTEAASLWDPNGGGALGVATGMATVGDTIMFGDSRRKYRVNGITYATSPSRVIIGFDNPTFDEDAGLATGEPTIFPSAPLRFRIYRKPSKSMVGGVSLPRGMCIDLSCSGAGVGGVDFGTAAIALNAGVSPPVPGAYGPIYIVFNPSGNVEEVYYSPAPGAAPVPHSVGYNLHLLVGRTDQVFPLVLPYLGAVPLNPVPPDSSRADARYNALDPANYWVTVNPFSGGITAAQVQDQSAFPIVPTTTTLTPIELLNLRIERSRNLASSGTQRSDQ